MKEREKIRYRLSVNHLSFAWLIDMLRKRGSQKGSPAEVRVIADTGTTVTMSRGGKTLTGTVASTGYATLYPTELGDWTIVFTYNGSQKTKVYTLEVIGIVYVYPFVVGATLEATSWDNIAAVSKFGQAPNYWKVGDKKNITVNGVTYAAQIIGFDHDTLTTADGSRTKAGITFQLVDCLSTTYSMNGSDTNVNGWRGSAMRTSTMATLLNQLSSDLKSVLKFVNKVTSAGNNSSGLETTSDKLFLLSEIEVFGATQYSYAGEGKQYEYYTAGNSTIMYAGKRLLRPDGRGQCTGYCIERHRVPCQRTPRTGRC